MIFFSKFRWKKCITLGKNSWAAYLERGDISTTDASVLLVHGFSCSASDFVGLLRTLPENYHVVAVDLLNHSDSSAITDRDVTIEDMAKFLKKVLPIFLLKISRSFNFLHLKHLYTTINSCFFSLLRKLV